MILQFAARVAIALLLRHKNENIARAGGEAESHSWFEISRERARVALPFRF